MMNNSTLQALSLLLISGSTASALVLPPPPSVVEANMRGKDIEYTPVIYTPDTTTQDAPPPPPSEIGLSAFHSTVAASYASLYKEQGLTPTGILTKGGAFTFSYFGEWNTSTGVDIVADFYYTALMKKSISELKDPISFSLGCEQELFPNLFGNISYVTHFDGLRGLYTKHHSRDGFVMEANINLRYNFVPSGFFLEIDYTPAFAGITGLATSLSGGYKYEFNERFSVVTTVESVFSWGYWDKEGLNSVSINLDLPITSEYKNITVAPFISCTWLGETGQEINRKNHTHVFKPFAFIAGARLEYTF